MHKTTRRKAWLASLQHSCLLVGWQHTNRAQFQSRTRPSERTGSLSVDLDIGVPDGKLFSIFLSITNLLVLYTLSVPPTTKSTKPPPCLRVVLSPCCKPGARVFNTFVLCRDITLECLPLGKRGYCCNLKTRTPVHPRRLHCSRFVRLFWLSYTIPQSVGNPCMAHPVFDTAHTHTIFFSFLSSLPPPSFPSFCLLPHTQYER